MASYQVVLPLLIFLVLTDKANSCFFLMTAYLSYQPDNGQFSESILFSCSRGLSSSKSVLLATCRAQQPSRYHPIHTELPWFYAMCDLDLFLQKLKYQEYLCRHLFSSLHSLLRCFPHTVWKEGQWIKHWILKYEVQIQGPSHFMFQRGILALALLSLIR